MEEMMMTQAELNAMLVKNPSLRVRGTMKKPKANEQLAKLMDMARASGRSSKYWNIKVYVQEKGVAVEKSDPALGKVLAVYDSLKEYDRGIMLQLLQRQGLISNLKRQVKLVIQEPFDYEGERIEEIYYRADFIYIKEGRMVVEDVKGFDEESQTYRTTADFKLKWKLLKYRYPEYLFTIF